MSDGADGFGGGLFVGTFVTAMAVLAVFRLTLVNISDAELYRFCMTKNITLAECKITREMLDKKEEQPKP